MEQLIGRILPLRKRITFLCIGIALLASLAACSSAGESPPTLTAQSERAIHLATQVAGEMQGALQVETTRAAGELQATTQAENARATAIAQSVQNAIDTSSQWPVLIYDSFDSDLGYFETGENIDDLGKSWWSIADGRYEWRAEAGTGLVWWATPDTEPLGDFYLSVYAQKLTGASSATYGLVFRALDIKHYYILQVSDTQRYCVYAYDYENGWIALIPWSDAPALFTDEPNHLTVIGQGETFFLFFNEQYVNQVSDSLFATGEAGLLIGLDNAGEQGTWAFDDFELRVPQLPATAETPTP